MDSFNYLSVSKRVNRVKIDSSFTMNPLQPFIIVLKQVEERQRGKVLPKNATKVSR